MDRRNRSDVLELRRKITKAQKMVTNFDEHGIISVWHDLLPRYEEQLKALTKRQPKPKPVDQQPEEEQQYGAPN